MRAPITALLMVTSTGPVIAVEISGTDDMRYRAVRSLVGGGWLEVVTGRYLGSEWAMYLDEDGHPARLPVNENATRLATLLGWHHRAGDVLVGTVVLVGRTIGRDVTVPPVVVRAARELEIAVMTTEGTHYDEERVAAW